MSKMLICFSHHLTSEQEKEARELFKISSFEYMEQVLADKWSQIPTGTEYDKTIINDITNWIRKQAQPGDYLLVQGDFGMTVYFACWASMNNIIPVYATTEREYSSKVDDNNSIVNIHRFKHKGFRKYVFPCREMEE